MQSILDVVMLALDVYVWIIIGSAIFSWLYAFNIVNPQNPLVGTIGNFLYQATEPVLRPIRRMLPNLGTIDISPIVLLLAIFFLQSVIVRYVRPYVF